MKPVHLDEMDSHVLPIANVVRRQYPHSEFEDIVQELRMWWVRNPSKVKEYVNHESKREGDALLAKSLLNRGRSFARQAQAERLGYSTQDLVHYSEAEIEELLASVLDPQAWLAPPAPEKGEARSKRDPAEGGNWLASLADVADAFRRLDRDTQLMLTWRYRDNATLADIGEQFDLAESTAHERIVKAVRRMHRLLGGDRPTDAPDEIQVSGLRHAISNAHAQAITGAEYSGE